MDANRQYYVNPYQKELTTSVTACEEAKGKWRVELEETIFYPTGGGQPCDTGTIDVAEVSDVFEDGNRVIHLCDRPLAVGSTVLCRIDWDRRFMLMQQHSGEHMLSGIVFSRFGYHNVGFHMGSDVITIDFSGEINEPQLHELESAVNDVIYRDIPSHIFYPDPEALATLSYRSKKALTGTVRLVQFQDIDLCACCGLHVRRSGEVGLVKLLSTAKFHDGSRIELLCGARALEYLNLVFEQNRRISALLSAKPLATAAAVERVGEELKKAQYRCTSLENASFAALAERYCGVGDVLLFESELSPDALRRLCDAVLHTCGGLCAVFSEQGESYRYAVGCLEGDLHDFVRTLNLALRGRGGGKGSFAQGSVSASKAEIEAFFANRKP